MCGSSASYAYGSVGKSHPNEGPGTGDEATAVVSAAGNLFKPRPATATPAPKIFKASRRDKLLPEEEVMPGTLTKNLPEESAGLSSLFSRGWPGPPCS